jgi:hypothetical protein
MREGGKVVEERERRGGKREGRGGGEEGSGHHGISLLFCRSLLTVVSGSA